MGMTWVINLKARAALLVVGLLATLLVLALSACGGAGGSAQEEEQADKVHHIPEDSQTYADKPLPAGHHVTEEFRPTMSFDLDTGWTRGGPELRDAWAIVDIDNDAYWLGFLNAEEVYKPNGSGGQEVGPAPEDRPNDVLRSSAHRPTEESYRAGSWSRMSASRRRQVQIVSHSRGRTGPFSCSPSWPSWQRALHWRCCSPLCLLVTTLLRPASHET